jgi:hypothetical protein
VLLLGPLVSSAVLLGPTRRSLLETQVSVHIPYGRATITSRLPHADHKPIASVYFRAHVSATSLLATPKGTLSNHSGPSSYSFVSITRDLLQVSPQQLLRPQSSPSGLLLPFSCVRAHLYQCLPRDSIPAALTV